MEKTAKNLLVGDIIDGQYKVIHCEVMETEDDHNGAILVEVTPDYHPGYNHLVFEPSEVVRISEAF